MFNTYNSLNAYYNMRIAYMNDTSRSYESVTLDYFFLCVMSTSTSELNIFLISLIAFYFVS